MCVKYFLLTVYVYFKGVRKMVVVENLLYILDTEVSSVVSPVAVGITCGIWCLHVEMCALCLCSGCRTPWVSGIYISSSWFTIGRIFPFKTLNSPQNVARPRWWRMYQCLIIICMFNHIRIQRNVPQIKHIENVN